MRLNFENRIKVLNKKIENYINQIPRSDYEKINTNYEFPLLTFLDQDDYNDIKSEILQLRNDIIQSYVHGNSETREEIRELLKENEYFGMVFTPNVNEIDNVSNKEDYILRILISISIKNLNVDIRDLIIYMNSLKKLAEENGIDINKLLKEVIPISSEIAENYSISMKDFFEHYLNGESIPIKL